MLRSINPTDGQVIRDYPEAAPDEVNQQIQATHNAYNEWRYTGFQLRSDLMKRAAEVLRNKAGQLAELMALEMGKPIREGRQEANKCALVCDFYAENAEAFLAHESIATDASHSYVSYQPLGVVLAVMPWNFPFWQVFRFAAPTLMAGNTGLLKHSSNVCGCALAIESIFREAGFPESTFTTLLVSGRNVTPIIAHPHVSAVTLTGSTPAGQAVAAAAGKALKKTVLELGGSDPYVVLRDADLDQTVDICGSSRMINGGQSCIAAKRFIVDKSIRSEFEKRFVDWMKNVRMGDPMDEQTTLGPQARDDLRDELHQQVVESVAIGARILIGGEIPDQPGAWYPPTILTNVKPGMPAYDDELFGPVAAIIEADDTDDAVRIANDTIFGLGAAVFTQDLETGQHIAEVSLEAGACFVNTFVRSDPRLPFGGIKQSGYGRELSKHGIREFVNTKTVYIA